jgi:hypothetical protein
VEAEKPQTKEERRRITMDKQFEKNGPMARLVNLAGVALRVLMLTLVVSLASHQPATAAAGGKAPADPRRAFYLTPLTYDGAQALNACAAGYHMASMWEIVDPSNLRYDTTLGFTRSDSGFGPPSAPGDFGWVRTGRIGDDDLAAGGSNCFNWTQSAPSAIGTRVSLGGGLSSQHYWDSATEVTRISPWLAEAAHCDGTDGATRVWCVQD